MRLSHYFSFHSLISVLVLSTAWIFSPVIAAAERAWDNAFVKPHAERQRPELFFQPATVAGVPGALAALRSFVTRQLQRTSMRRASPPFDGALARC